MNRLITLTEERLEKLKTPKGGYNSAQLEHLGVKWEHGKGFPSELIGEKISLYRFIMSAIYSLNYEYIEEIKNSLDKIKPPLNGRINFDRLIKQAELERKQRLKVESFFKQRV